MQLTSLQQTAHELGRQIHVTLYGRADQTGAETKNATLSTERARTRAGSLAQARASRPDMVTAIGLGDSEPIDRGSAAHQLEVNRSVSLKVQSQQQGDRQ